MSYVVFSMSYVVFSMSYVVFLISNMVFTSFNTFIPPTAQQKHKHCILA